MQAENEFWDQHENQTSSFLVAQYPHNEGAICLLSFFFFFLGGGGGLVDFMKGTSKQKMGNKGTSGLGCQALDKVAIAEAHEGTS